jgi:gluconolactonase
VKPQFAAELDVWTFRPAVRSAAKWAEGPAWNPLTRKLLWSDVGQDAVYEWDYETGSNQCVLQGAGFYINGNFYDAPRKRYVHCSHARRCVLESTETTVFDTLIEGEFNSPSDVIVSQDGKVIFSDPPYGAVYGGLPLSSMGECYVYTAKDGEVERSQWALHPNGLALSNDESVLYVIDSSRAFGPKYNACLYANGEIVAHFDGLPDGMKVDALDRVWVATSRGVIVLDQSRKEIARFELPEKASNLEFISDHEVVVTATSSLYILRFMT